MNSFGGNFGQLIKERRGVEGLTQEALAFQAGVTKAQISDLENDKIPNPHAKTVDALCVALNIEKEERSACHSEDLKLPEGILKTLADRFGLNDPNLSELALNNFLNEASIKFEKMQASLRKLSTEESRLENVVDAARYAFESGDFSGGDKLLAGAEEIQETSRTLKEVRIQSQIRIERGKAALLGQDVVQAFEHFKVAAEYFEAFSQDAMANVFFESAEALREHGLVFPGKGLSLSIVAYESCLCIWTKERHPLDWAKATNYLAVSTHRIGSRLTNEQGAKLVEKAIELHKRALTVRTIEVSPLDWSISMNNLAIAQSRLGRFSKGARKRKLISEAARNHKLTLQVRTRAVYPVNWGVSMHNIAYCSRHLGTCSEGLNAEKYFDEAIQHYKLALEERTLEKGLTKWAMSTTGLASSIRCLAMIKAGSERHRLLEEAREIIEEVLNACPHSKYPIRWADAAEGAVIILIRIAQEDVRKAGDPLRRARELLDTAKGIARTDDLEGLRTRLEKLDEEINESS